VCDILLLQKPHTLNNIAHYDEFGGQRNHIPKLDGIAFERELWRVVHQQLIWTLAIVVVLG